MVKPKWNAYARVVNVILSFLRRNKAKRRSIRPELRKEPRITRSASKLVPKKKRSQSSRTSRALRNV